MLSKSCILIKLDLYHHTHSKMSSCSEIPELLHEPSVMVKLLTKISARSLRSSKGGLNCRYGFALTGEPLRGPL